MGTKTSWWLRGDSGGWMCAWEMRDIHSSNHHEYEDSVCGDAGFSIGPDGGFSNRVCDDEPWSDGVGWSPKTFPIMNPDGSGASKVEP
jgi:hypothetical protein